MPPSWKATIGGKEYGLDGQWITVAGLKIPSLILALIPMPNGGNESRALDVQGRMRAQDYQMALPRAAAAADQEEQIRAIRERLAAERELNLKQREPSARPTDE
jgi:nitrate/nitrite-specific signal transduction histidine kinase